MAEDQTGKSARSIKPACRQFDEQLAAYFEGEEGTAVPSHAAECSACGAVIQDLGLIRSAARELPLDSPPPRVWKKVRAALGREGLIRPAERHWLRWLGNLSVPAGAAPLTAAAGLAVFVIVLVFGPKFSRKPVPVAPRTDLAAAAFNASYTAQELALAETVQQMELTFKARELAFPPLIKSTYDKGLESLDTSIRESLASVQQEPQNALARQYLMDAYARKADVLASALEYDGR